LDRLCCLVQPQRVSTTLSDSEYPPPAAGQGDTAALRKVRTAEPAENAIASRRRLGYFTPSLNLKIPPV
jgi:hypothetical protein